jgi:hypothetical protein
MVNCDELIGTTEYDSIGEVRINRCHYNRVLLYNTEQSPLKFVLYTTFCYRTYWASRKRLIFYGHGNKCTLQLVTHTASLIISRNPVVKFHLSPPPCNT